MKQFFIIIFIIIICLPLIAKPEVAGYPFAGISDETGFYGGVLAYLRYRPVHVDSAAYKNVFYLSSAYSEKKQFNVLFESTIRFRNGLYELKAELEHKKWPSEFYGTGMETDSDQLEKFTSVEKRLNLKFNRKLSEIWNASLDFDILDFDISEMEAGGILENGNFFDPEKRISSGIGFTVNFDTRNSESYPTNGELLSWQFTTFSKSSASNHEFSRTILDLRKYLQIHGQHTLAIQSYFSSISGKVPFHQMNCLSDNMRAITSNLYIDKNVYVLRMEDRFFHWDNGFKKRLGLVFFAELGEVSSKISTFNIEQIQFNYGLGFRYSFFLDDRMNARLDIGFGEVRASISMATGEVF